MSAKFPRGEQTHSQPFVYIIHVLLLRIFEEIYAIRMVKAAKTNITLKLYNTRFKFESIIVGFLGHVFFHLILQHFCEISIVLELRK